MKKILISVLFIALSAAYAYADGFTPLPAFAYKSKVEQLKDYSDFVDSIRYCDMDTAVELLKQGVPKDLKRREDNYDTPLIIAIKNNCLPAAKLLLTMGVRPSNNTHDDYRVNPLNLAADKEPSVNDGGWQDVVEKLIAAGASPNLADEDGNTALIIAVKNNYYDYVEMMLEDSYVRIDEYDKKTLRTATMWAAYYGYADIGRLLLEYDPNLEKKDIYGQTAYDIAFTGGGEDDALMYKPS